MRRISNHLQSLLRARRIFCAGRLTYAAAGRILTAIEQDFQGGVKFSTGGIAHEPQGMIRCDSEADSIVWMKENLFTQRELCN